MKLYHQSELGTLYKGNALKMAEVLSPESIDCVITSPPYFSQRSYQTETTPIWGGDLTCKHEWGKEIKVQRHKKGETNPGKEARFKEQGGINQSGGMFCEICGAWKGSLGEEPQIDLYISHLCDIFDEVKKVLKKTGTLFVNLADTYWGGGRGGSDHGGKENLNQKGYGHSAKGKGYQNKCMCCVPERFKIEMVNRGWIARQTIIWKKTNVKPESVTDRFTNNFEYVYFFTKQQKYFFEQQFEGYENSTNKRCVWEIPTQSFPMNWCPYCHKSIKRNEIDFDEFIHRECGHKLISHFSTFPEELLIPLILAGVPKYICRECGQPMKKIYEEERVSTRKGTNAGKGKSGKDIDPEKDFHLSELSTKRQKIIRKEIGYSKCDCKNENYKPGTVLDPFMGTGRLAIVAEKYNRKWIGFETSANYCDMIIENVKHIQRNLFD